MDLDAIKQFEEERKIRIKEQGKNNKLVSSAKKFMEESVDPLYSYNFSWMGRPIIQYPQDMIAMQEILWQLRPDIVVETGIAHGGSLIFYASILELIGHGEVLGIDVEIRPHNRKAIEKHSMFKRISMLEGGSTSLKILKEVETSVDGKERVLVCLDSNHTHDHVYKELCAYSKFVTKGSYLIVFDTMIEDMPEGCYPNRTWGRGNNPKTAVHQFLKENDRFVIDDSIENKLLMTVAPDGYLRCVK